MRSQALVDDNRLTPVLELNGGKLAHILMVLSLISAGAQLVVGASPLVVALAVVGIIAGLYGFIFLGDFNIASWVAFFYVLGNIVVALFAKTLLWQPLDSFLFAPLGSYFAQTVATAGLVLALLLVSRLHVGGPILSPVSDSGYLRVLSWSTFFLGIGFVLLDYRYQDPYSGSGFGGIAVFKDFLIMAVIARTAMLLEQSEDRRSFDGWLGVMMASGLVVGLLANQKTSSALPIVAYFATVLFYRRDIRLKQLLALGIGGVIFMTIMGPMIHVYRIMGQQRLSLQERIEFIGSNTEKLLDSPRQMTRLNRYASGAFRGSYYDYFHGSSSNQMFLVRYSMVQSIDPVIYEVDRHGPQGGDAVWPAFKRIMPRIMFPDKPEYIEGYTTLVHFRLVAPEGGKFPTLPLAGQAYAAYALTGLALIPFMTFFVFFLVLKKLGWSLYRNVYAVFFLVIFVLVYTNQGSVAQYFSASFRTFPLFAASFLAISTTFRYLNRSSLDVPLQ